jgi:hypothetical protein
MIAAVILDKIQVIFIIFSLKQSDDQYVGGIALSRILFSSAGIGADCLLNANSCALYKMTNYSRCIGDWLPTPDRYIDTCANIDYVRDGYYCPDDTSMSTGICCDLVDLSIWKLLLQLDCIPIVGANRMALDLCVLMMDICSRDMQIRLPAKFYTILVVKTKVNIF